MDRNSLQTGLSAPTLALSWPTRLSSRVTSFLFLFFQAVSINIFDRRSDYEKPLPSMPQTRFVAIAVQLLSRVWLFVTPWTAARQASLSFTILQSSLIRSCYLNISSSAFPFSFCLRFLPASESFPMSRLFTAGAQSTGASAWVLPMNIQCWFPLGSTDSSPCSQTDSQESSPESKFKSISYPLSMGFPRQEYWSGLPFPSPGDLPDSGVKPTSPALAGGFLTAEPPGKRPQTH